MSTARYVVAVLVWVMLPPAVIYWLMLHPFVDFWRRRGKVVTFWSIGIVFVGLMVLLYGLRELVLVQEYGTHWVLWLAAATSYVISIAIEARCRKHLKWKTLAGVPEVEADQSERKLLDQGIYGRVRHPRYVAVMIAMLAMALFANYLAIWLLLGFTIASLYAVATLEERELVASMGERYEDYRRRVPMFVPKRANRQ